jgi:hypothetical protein
MAEIAKSGTPSLATALPGANDQIAGLLAGEAIAAGDACYITSGGVAMRASGAAANAAANVRGIAADAAQSGEAVTLYRNVRFGYGSGLTPGASYYLSGTVAGGLADAASTGGTTVIGFAVDSTRIQFKGL